MQCLTPLTIQKNGQDLAISCGQCAPCRINRREEWAARILLEAAGHEMSWFLTLTYKPGEVVYNCRKGEDPVKTITKCDPRNFMKRLRKRFPTERIRYFCVGEYGSRTGRPHYHFVLFGPPKDPTAEVAASWEPGFISCAELTPERARYVARYTTKKMTGPLSYSDGRLPEFATMSRRPGLGRTQALKIGRLLATSVGLGATIPNAVRIGGKSLRLDAYMKRMIASELGYESARQEAAQFRAHKAAPERRAFARQKGGAGTSQEMEIRDSAYRKAREKL